VEFWGGVLGGGFVSFWVEGFGSGEDGVLSGRGDWE
jgi:hypothetical protein